MATVCLVTTGHPSTNPRLVKEADALAEAGYDVRVVATKFWQWASEADAAFDNRPWPISYVRFGEMATGVGETWIRARQRAAREVAARWGRGSFRRPSLSARRTTSRSISAARRGHHRRSIHRAQSRRAAGRGRRGAPARCSSRV